MSRRRRNEEAGTLKYLQEVKHLLSQVAAFEDDDNIADLAIEAEELVEKALRLLERGR